MRDMRDMSVRPKQNRFVSFLVWMLSSFLSLTGFEKVLPMNIIDIFLVLSTKMIAWDGSDVKECFYVNDDK